MEQLASEDVRSRMAAVDQLRTLGTAAAPALQQALRHDQRPVVRRWCTHLLGVVGGRNAASAIVSATGDSVAAVRLLALQTLALGQAGGKDLGLDPVPHLVRLARQDRSKRVREAALQFLATRRADPRAAACLRAASLEAPPPPRPAAVEESAGMPARPAAVRAGA